jgi:surface protein
VEVESCPCSQNSLVEEFLAGVGVDEDFPILINLRASEDPDSTRQFVCHTRRLAGTVSREMDCVTMVLVERETGLPLDLVVLINSFLYERLTDENFKQAIDLWFGNKEECKFRFGHISDWNTSRVTNMEGIFYHISDFNENISRWDVGRVTNMREMFALASHFNQDIGQWDVRNVTDMEGMFFGAASCRGVRWS